MTFDWSRPNLTSFKTEVYQDFVFSRLHVKKKKPKKTPPQQHEIAMNFLPKKDARLHKTITMCGFLLLNHNHS